MVTPSGTNQFRGSVFEFNRDSDLVGQLLLQQPDGRAEVRTEAQPVRRPSRRPGAEEQAVLLRLLRGLPPDDADRAEPDRAGESRPVERRVPLRRDRRHRALGERHAVVRPAGRPEAAYRTSSRRSRAPAAPWPTTTTRATRRADRILNTAGYRYNQTDLNNRDQYGFRLDYEMSPKHRFEGIYSYFKETDDRTDLDAVTTEGPLVYTSSDPKRLSTAWRWLAGLAVPERDAIRVQPGAGAVRQRLGLQRCRYHLQHRAEPRESARRLQHGRRDRRVPAAGPLHEHVPVHRQRLDGAGVARDAVRRQLAAATA